MMTDGADSRRWRWLAAAYFVAISLGHLQFSLWLVRRRQWGEYSFSFSQAMPLLAGAGAVALVLWIIHVARQHPWPYRWLGVWLLWACCVALVDRYLTYSLNETAHYPQYALLAWLIARSLDPQRKWWQTGRVLFWTTLLGIGDEVLQYLWITSSYSEYLDFNDFIVNLLAAVAGMLIYYSRSAEVGATAARQFPVRELGIAMLITVCVIVAVGTGRLVVEPAVAVPAGGLMQIADGTWQLSLQRKPGLYARFDVGPYRGRYWVLDPLRGILLLLAAGAAFTVLTLGLRRRPRFR